MKTFGELRPEKRAKVRGQYYSLTLLHSDTVMQDSRLKSSIMTQLCRKTTHNLFKQLLLQDSGLKSYVMAQ